MIPSQTTLSWITLCIAAAIIAAQVDAWQTEFDLGRLKKIDPIVNQHINSGQLPGCVIAIGNSRELVFIKSYGNRQLLPTELEMTDDTIFDLASLTKPIATGSAIMCLIEDGLIRLNDTVSKHLPEFTGNEKEKITIKQLLIHVSGLVPDNALSDYQQSEEIAWQKICELKLSYLTGSTFSYSDVGFIVLAKLVERITSKNLNAYLQERLFQPLAMRESGFLPSEPLRKRSAPTERRQDRWMQGEVHDPRAFLLGGMAGHAGLFSSARDLSRYARMMLNGGELDGRRVLKHQTIQWMTQPYDVPNGTRGLGWDKNSSYSSNRSDLYSGLAFGHGGFTGTAIWIDPEIDLFVIFLANRVHPDGKGRMNKLAAQVGSIAVSSINDPLAETKRVKCGIDVLGDNNFLQLKGKRVGLIANQTSLNAQGVSSVQLLNGAQDVQLIKLFSPEHGFTGKLDQATVEDSTDSETGLNVISLYGKSRKPEQNDLMPLDVLVFDIQDIGTRFYTYISTMGLAMQSASEAEIEFMVLDRPNPINGRSVSGPVADLDLLSFTAFHTLPIRHGMTVGEIAMMLADEQKLNLKLTIIPMTDWKRPFYWNQTGLTWVNPSPNMRSPTQAILYPGIGLLETTNLSVGRGTDSPFEIFGAPWLDSRELAAILNSSGLTGVRFESLNFQPNSSKYVGQQCHGVRIEITERDSFEPIVTGLHIAATLKNLYPEKWDSKSYLRLLANRQAYELLERKASRRQIQGAWKPNLDQFMMRRSQYLIYE